MDRHPLNRSRSSTIVWASLTLCAVAGLASQALGAEVITVRSGQVGGLPGLAGQADDIVTNLPNNPPGGQVSASPFTPADFAGAVSGPAAQVINAYSVWTPGLSDPLARWINWSADITPQPDGTVSGTGYGNPGSALYAVPFVVTTPGATFATLNLELAVDDALGDWFVAGPNPDGLYINGVSTGYQGGNYATPTFHTQVIPVSTGLNYLYFYQRDLGVLVSGLIFSATLTVPAPGAMALLGMGGLVAVRRRRR